MYTGITTDIDRRLYEHNNTSRAAKYTRARRPVNLLCSVDFSNRSEASQAEARFKRLTRKQKLLYISGELCINDLLKEKFK